MYCEKIHEIVLFHIICNKSYKYNQLHFLNLIHMYCVGNLTPLIGGNIKSSKTGPAKVFELAFLGSPLYLVKHLELSSGPALYIMCWQMCQPFRGGCFRVVKTK